MFMKNNSSIFITGIKDIGDLQITSIIICYDIPYLFIGEKDKKYYLCFCTNMNDDQINDKKYTYIIAEINYLDSQLLLNGSKSMQTCMLNSNNIILLTKNFSDSENTFYTKISNEDINKFLPKEEIYYKK